MTTMFGQPNEDYAVSSGVTYKADHTGQILNVASQQDQQDLINAGCVVQAPVQHAAGGAAIEPETGSSGIKISAFPDAATNMGSGDRVTGLQGGANVNFSQAQLLTGAVGANIALTGGAGNSLVNGGNVTVQGGPGSTGSGAGNIYLLGGTQNGPNAPGYVHIAAADAMAGATSGGILYLRTGAGYGGHGGELRINTGNGGGSANDSGGSFNIYLGNGAGDGNGGDMKITLGALAGTGRQGQFIIANLPTSAAGLPSGSVWNNAGVLNIA
jgi:hypothetical protein